MAAKLPSVSALRTITRGYAAQAQAKAASYSASSKKEQKTTTLPSGLVVTAVDNNSPVSQVSIVFRAGSRHESANAQGVAHFMRICAGLTNKNSTQFGLTRSILQSGGSLTCTGGREYTAYTLVNTRDKIENTWKFLSDAATKQVFKPWELSDNESRLRLDVAIMDPQTRVLELLHKAAFRTGLGYSLYTPKYMIGRHDPETMQSFVQQNFTSNRTSVVGVGISHDVLANFAQKLALESGAGPQSSGKYTGGELRKERAGSLTYVAAGVEGVSWANQKECLAWAVLQYAMGTAPSVSYGLSTSKLGKAIQGASKQPASIRAFSSSYSDTGLFGFVLQGNAGEMDQLVKTAVKELRSGSVSDADVARGKAQLKSALLMADESGSSTLEVLSLQSLYTRGAVPVAELAQSADSVSAADVNAVAKKIASGKLSFAALGNLSNTPFLDSL